VPKLIEAAKAAEDGALADLITLGAYTGARIEELCALQWAEVQLDAAPGRASFQIVDSKTEAGIREVPIHSALRPVLKRLKKEPRTTTSSGA
jgi:integrase